VTAHPHPILDHSLGNKDSWGPAVNGSAGTLNGIIQCVCVIWHQLRGEAWITVTPHFHVASIWNLTPSPGTHPQVHPACWWVVLWWFDMWRHLYVHSLGGRHLLVCTVIIRFRCFKMSPPKAPCFIMRSVYTSSWNPATRVTLNSHSKLNFHLQINCSLPF